MTIFVNTPPNDHHRFSLERPAQTSKNDIPVTAHPRHSPLVQSPVKVRHSHTPSARRSSSGFTMIELLVAITMTSLVLASIFFAWNTLNRQVFKQRRESLFLSDITSFANHLATQIRKSPRILFYDQTAIEFISPHNEKPVRYEFYYDELLRNDSLVTLSAQGAKITDFHIDGDDYHYADDLPMLLIDISIRAEDTFGNEHEVTVSAAVEPPTADEDEGGWQW